MTKRPRKIVRLLMILMAADGLVSCAARVPPTIESAQPPPSTGGGIILGTVAAVRPVSVQSGSNSAVIGVNDVLAALSQEAINSPVSGAEIVVKKNDGNPTTIVDRDVLPGIEVGNRVALLQTGPIVIIRRN